MRRMLFVNDLEEVGSESDFSEEGNKIIKFEKEMTELLKEIKEEMPRDEELNIGVVLYKNIEEMIRTYKENGWKNAKKHIQMYSEKGENIEELTKEFIVFDYKSEIYIYLTKNDIKSKKEFLKKIRELKF